VDLPQLCAVSRNVFGHKLASIDIAHLCICGNSLRQIILVRVQKIHINNHISSVLIETLFNVLPLKNIPTLNKIKITSI
jgi:hypothetical protein